MRIKIDHIPLSKDDKDVINPTTNVRIYDKETGKALGGVQKLEITYESGDFVPRAKIETINFETRISEAEVDEVKIIGYGPYYMKIEDMDRKHLIQALRYEAAMRFKEKHKTAVCINPFEKE